MKRHLSSFLHTPFSFLSTTTIHVHIAHYNNYICTLAEGSHFHRVTKNNIVTVIQIAIVLDNSEQYNSDIYFMESMKPNLDRLIKSICSRMFTEQQTFFYLADGNTYGYLFSNLNNRTHTKEVIFILTVVGTHSRSCCVSIISPSFKAGEIRN